MKIKINDNYTYWTDEKAEVGDTAILPSPSYIPGPSTWEGKVTATESDYDGYCINVIKIIKNDN